MILGEKADPEGDLTLSGADKAIDETLDAIYGSGRLGAWSDSSPKINRWLGDIRTYFPKPVVTMLQKDAVEKLGLQRFLAEPELMESLEADVSLVNKLVLLTKLGYVSKDGAYQLIRKIVEEIRKKLKFPLEEAVRGSLSRKRRHYRPRWKELDWHATIRANLRHYQPEYRTVLPEKLIGYKRNQHSLRHFFLAVDQSGSMSDSLVYAGIMGSILVGLPSFQTRLAVFDTSVADLSHHLSNPVELLMGTQLGGGTDVANALLYVRRQIQYPNQSLLVIISDLYEGGDRRQMLHHFRSLVLSGVRVICLLALSDKGVPDFDTDNARELANMGIPAFACTPQHFPDLIAAALNGQDLFSWQHEHVVRKNGRAVLPE